MTLMARNNCYACAISGSFRCQTFPLSPSPVLIGNITDDCILKSYLLAYTYTNFLVRQHKVIQVLASTSSGAVPALWLRHYFIMELSSATNLSKGSSISLTDFCVVLICKSWHTTGELGSSKTKRCTNSRGFLKAYLFCSRGCVEDCD